MKKLRTQDPVMVIAGKHKWKISIIESIEWDMVFLKWVNEVKKAVKWKWFIKKILPLHISNVMYYSESEKKPAKVSISIDAKWNKKRVLKKLNIEVK